MYRKRPSCTLNSRKIRPTFSEASQGHGERLTSLKTRDGGRYFHASCEKAGQRWEAEKKHYSQCSSCTEDEKLSSVNDHVSELLGSQHAMASSYSVSSKAAQGCGVSLGGKGCQERNFSRELLWQLLRFRNPICPEVPHPKYIFRCSKPTVDDGQNQEERYDGQRNILCID